eukprot:2102644-Prymnesium_polylepis.1
MHCKFARWAGGCDLDQYTGVTRCRETVLWAASFLEGGSRLCLAARGWHWLRSAVADMSMLTSTVW